MLDVGCSPLILGAFLAGLEKLWICSALQPVPCKTGLMICKWELSGSSGLRPPARWPPRRTPRPRLEADHARLASGRSVPSAGAEGAGAVSAEAAVLFASSPPAPGRERGCPGPPSAGGLQGAERPRSRGMGTRPWGDVVGAGCALLPESSGRPGGQLALPPLRQRFHVALPPQTGRRRSFVHLAGRGLPDGTR